MRNKYAVSPFKRATKQKVNRLNVNALSFDPTTLNVNAKEFNPLNPEVEPFTMPTAIEEEEEVDEAQEEGVSDVYGSPFGEQTTEKRQEPDYNNDVTILALHGFRKIKKMEDSLQGKIYLGETIVGH